MARFSYLLQRKIALLFPVKKPFFWKKRQIFPSLDDIVLAGDDDDEDVNNSSFLHKIVSRGGTNLGQICIFSAKK